MWLLREDVAQALKQARSSGVQPTAAQQAEMVLRRSRAAANGENPAMTIAGDVAEIRVYGTLTPQPDIFAWLFGGGNTTYGDLVDALAVAQTKPDVKRVRLLVDSPGGTVAGLFETLHSIQTLKDSGKPITVQATMACSAAYAIAAVAGPITASTAASQFGSVGVAITYINDDEIIELASRAAPKKRPDVSTEEGKSVVQDYLDSIHALFADAIASGRGVSRETVNSEFGQGAVLLAGDAKSRSMIDKIAVPALRPVGRSKVAAGAQEEEMDLLTLKTQHPELYSACLLEGAKLNGNQQVPGAPVPAPQNGNSNAPVPGAGQEKSMDLKTLKTQHPDAYDAAVAEGVKQERERVQAHLNLGEACGDMKIALQAINNGDGLTPKVHSLYLAAGMNRSDRNARQAETDAAGAATDGATAPETPEAKTKGDIVADLVEQQLGIPKKKAS